MPEQPEPSANFPLLAAICEGSLSIVAVALGWLLGHPPLRMVEFSWQSTALGVAAVVPQLILLFLCVLLPVWPFSAVRRVVEEVLIPWFRNCTLLELAVISLLAGLGEELLFRGVFQTALSAGISFLLPAAVGSGLVADWIAAGCVAVLFGLLHAVNGGYAVLAGVVGLYLSWLLLATGNLAVPITAHAVYDFLALVYLSRRK